MEYDDNEFMRRHAYFVNWPYYEEYQGYGAFLLVPYHAEDETELIERARDAVDEVAVIDAIEETFLEKLGAQNYNRYFCYLTGSPVICYSLSDEDGGKRVLEQIYSIAQREHSLSSFFRILTVTTQKEAVYTHEYGIKYDEVKPIKEAIENEYGITNPCPSCNGYPWACYLALHRSGNYLRGERIPEAVELLDKYKERHAMECNGCSYWLQDRPRAARD